jgi:hypothetical protein
MYNVHVYNYYLCVDYCVIFPISFAVFDAKDPMRRKFVVRMRCAFTPSVRSITRCSNFKVQHISMFKPVCGEGGERNEREGERARGEGGREREEERKRGE